MGDPNLLPYDIVWEDSSGITTIENGVVTNVPFSVSNNALWSSDWSVSVINRYGCREVLAFTIGISNIPPVASFYIDTKLWYITINIGN